MTYGWIDDEFVDKKKQNENSNIENAPWHLILYVM